MAKRRIAKKSYSFASLTFVFGDVFTRAGSCVAFKETTVFVVHVKIDDSMSRLCGRSEKWLDEGTKMVETREESTKSGSNVDKSVHR